MDIYDPTTDAIPASIPPSADGYIHVPGDVSAIYSLTPSAALSALFLPITAPVLHNRHIWQACASTLTMQEEMWCRFGSYDTVVPGDYYWAQLQQDEDRKYLGATFTYTLAIPDLTIWEEISWDMYPAGLILEIAAVPSPFPTSYPKSSPGIYHLIAEYAERDDAATFRGSYASPYSGEAFVLLASNHWLMQWYFHLNNSVGRKWYRTKAAVPRTGGLVTTLAGLALVSSLFCVGQAVGDRPRRV